MIKGIGIDVIEIPRIERIYRKYGDRFLQKVFTREERSYAKRFNAPESRLAARFAAKEACMKALGTGWSQGVRWRDIEVNSAPSDKPTLSLQNAAKKRFLKLKASSVHLTITHSRDLAIALVIIE